MAPFAIAAPLQSICVVPSMWAGESSRTVFAWQATQAMGAASRPPLVWAVCAPTVTSVVAVRPLVSLGGAPVPSLVPPWQAVQTDAVAPSPPWLAAVRAWPQPATKATRTQVAAKGENAILHEQIPSPPRHPTRGTERGFDLGQGGYG